MKKESCFIGAHTSTSGGLKNAIIEAHEIGANCFQCFTSNQKRWDPRKLTDEDISSWNETLEMYPMQYIMSHDSYLINLGAFSEDVHHKSQIAFREELKRCQALGISFLNFHPGAYTEGDEESCLKKIVHTLKSYEHLASEGKTRLLIEATAGQGTTVGYKFEHLGYLIDNLHTTIPIGVCIDTCHIFAAGYDIRTREAWDQTLKEFDEKVGLKHLYALHVNDSMKPFGSKKDRHASLGEGEIGLEGFKAMMQDQRLKHIPKYLETPEGPEVWKKEISLLKSFN
jgi:deoxyribonuclease IV